MTGLGGGGICAGQEIEQQRVGFCGLKEGIVKQDEFPKFRLEIAGRYWPIAEACRFGIGIRVKDSLRESVIAGPEPGAAYFVRIGFAHDRIGQSGHAAGMERSPPSGETSYCEIKAAPEEVDRAYLAQKAAAEKLEHAIGLDERAPEGMRRVGIIGSMQPIIREADRVLHLVRHFVYANGDPDAVQEIENPAVKLGNGLRFERMRPLRTPAGADGEAVTNEIKLNL